jgi:RNA polymerase sigma-70 factor (ECF subfamily)
MKGSSARRQDQESHEEAHPSVAQSVDPRDDLGALYRAHVGTVARWVARLGGPLIDVEDAVQEVFLVAERRRPTLAGPARITTWLYRVTAKVVSHRRRKDRIRRWLGGSSEEVAGHRQSEEPTPIEVLEARERAALVYRALDRMPEKYRAMIVLFEMEGMKGDQIAELYGAKVATVWVWLHRARALFLARLTECEAATASGRMLASARGGRA